MKRLNEVLINNSWFFLSLSKSINYIWCKHLQVSFWVWPKTPSPVKSEGTFQHFSTFDGFYCFERFITIVRILFYRSVSEWFSTHMLGLAWVIGLQLSKLRSIWWLVDCLVIDQTELEHGYSTNLMSQMWSNLQEIARRQPDCQYMHGDS